MAYRNLPQTGKGRSGDLIKSRNYALVNMYYYYTEIKGMRYDYAITALSRAFFISGRTIQNVMKEKQNSKLLTAIYAKKPSIEKVIAECFPFHIQISTREKERYLKQIEK